VLEALVKTVQQHQELEEVAEWALLVQLLMEVMEK
jgi:hypothetical protein